MATKLEPDAEKPGETPDPLSFNDECILHFAVRYALPRQTAASGIVVRILLRDWDRLRPGTAEQIRKEIQEEVTSERISRIDMAEWLKVPGVDGAEWLAKAERDAATRGEAVGF